MKPKICFIVDHLTRDDGKYLMSHAGTPELDLSPELKAEYLERFKDDDYIRFAVGGGVIFKCRGMMFKENDPNLYFPVYEIQGMDEWFEAMRTGGAQ